MNKPNFTKIFNNVKDAVGKHSPEILTGIGIAGMVTTTVLAVKATPKALELIKEDSRDNHDGDPYAYTKVEAVKSAWKCYIPATISGAVSIACIVGATSVNARRNAALATAYKIAETSLHEYRDKVVETIGEKKEKVIRDNIHQDRVDKNPVSRNEVIITGKGKTLCYDTISGRYFDSDIEDIKKAVNELNHRMLLENYISLSEFYDEIGLSHTKNSDDLGWNLNEEGLIELSFSPVMSEDDRPAIAIDYYVSPRYDFSKLM